METDDSKVHQSQMSAGGSAEGSRGSRCTSFLTNSDPPPMEESVQGQCESFPRRYETEELNFTQRD